MPRTCRLDQSVTELKGVGPAVAAKLARLNILTIRDLVTHWPRTWLDLTHPSDGASLVKDTRVVIDGTLTGIRVVHRTGRRKARVRAVLRCRSGKALPVVWFNQPYLGRSLRDGQDALLLGDLRWDWHEHCLVLSSPERFTRPEILAIYPETAGLSSRFLRSLLAFVIPRLALDDPLLSHASLGLLEAIGEIHQPSSMATLRQAEQRLALDEHVNLQLGIVRRRAIWEQRRSPQIQPSISELQQLAASLPFSLTDGQRRAAWEIIQELGNDRPMNRLLQGDVGTGKTIVGVLAAVSVVSARYSVAWLAPTRALATQLYARIRDTVASLGHQAALVLGGSRPDVSGPAMLIGTHALLNEDRHADRIALVIVDEQHRFGVRQRMKLVGTASEHTPHLLSMTATPIPRSLALSLYGDIALSTLRERPMSQRPVTTVVVRPEDRSVTVLPLLARALGAGRQAFIVTPRIHENRGETLFSAIRSLEAIQAEYQAALPNYSFVTYHGEQSEEENEQIMSRFEAGDINVLVATSMIEVGIDIPNAALMIIEHAERFGLAQLHQLRGRVGRGKYPGVCIAMPTASDTFSERLEHFRSTTDGFRLAEADLRERGPGSLAGHDQSGFLRLRFASLADTLMTEKALAIAEALTEAEPAALAGWQQFWQGEQDAGVVDAD